jgi:RHS repeat-associated protein
MPGQIWDSEAQASSNYQRWYRPNDGRYLSPDPIGLAGGEAGYFGYAAPNPLVATDPAGLRRKASHTIPEFTTANVDRLIWFLFFTFGDPSELESFNTYLDDETSTGILWDTSCLVHSGSPYRFITRHDSRWMDTHMGIHHKHFYEDGECLTPQQAEDYDASRVALVESDDELPEPPPQSQMQRLPLVFDKVNPVGVHIRRLTSKSR